MKDSKTQGKLERRVILVKPFFKIPFDKVQEESMLDFGNSRELVNECYFHMAIKENDVSHSSFKTLKRLGSNILISNYENEYEPEKDNFYCSSIRVSIRGISKNYSSLDKKLKEAGL